MVLLISILIYFLLLKSTFLNLSPFLVLCYSLSISVNLANPGVNVLDDVSEEMCSAWQFDQSKYNKHLSRFSVDLKDAFLQLYLQPDLPNCPWPEQRIVNNIVKAVAQHFHLLFFFKFDRG